MATSGMSLVAAFDDLVCSTDALSDGTEGGLWIIFLQSSKSFEEVLDLCCLSVFGNFVGHQIGFYKKLEALRAENKQLIKENEAKDINMKLSRLAVHGPVLTC